MTLMEEIVFGEATEVRQRRQFPPDIAIGISTELEFVDAPPAVKSRAGLPMRASRWPSVLESLRANPGRWARVGSFGSATNRPRTLKDAGVRFRVVSRSEHSAQANAVVIVFDLWACFPAEEPF